MLTVDAAKEPGSHNVNCNHIMGHEHKVQNLIYIRFNSSQLSIGFLWLK